MKKMTAILILLAMVLALSACGGNEPEAATDLEYVQGNGTMIDRFLPYLTSNLFIFFKTY